MKLRDTEFFKQFTAVVTATFLVVMTVAFITIPVTLAAPVAGLAPDGSPTRIA